MNLYTTDRATGISEGKKDYKTIWDPLEPGETIDVRIDKLKELEKKYTAYEEELIRSQAIANARKEAVDMINFFELCYTEISKAISLVREDMKGLINIDKDRADARNASDPAFLNVGDESLYRKYRRLLYENVGVTADGTSTGRNDLLTRTKIRFQEILSDCSTLYNSQIPNDAVYGSYKGTQYKAYTRSGQTDTLFVELEKAWGVSDQFKPSTVGPIIGQIQTNVGNAIDALLAQKDNKVKVVQTGKYFSDSEVTQFNTALQKLSFLTSNYANVYNCRDTLKRYDVSQEGQGFLSRVEQSIRLDVDKPRLLALIDNYKQVYDKIVGRDIITTNPFEEETQDYDISRYVVNEIRVLNEMGILDARSWSVPALLGTTDTSIPQGILNPSDYRNFSLKNLRITGGSMIGGWVGNPISRVARVSASDTEAIFIVSCKAGFYKMVEVIVSYSSTNGLKAKLGIAKYADMWNDAAPPVQKSLQEIWNNANGTYSAPISTLTNGTYSQGYAVNSLTIGYRNFYNNHDTDKTTIDSINILDKGSSFDKPLPNSPSASLSPSTSASTGSKSVEISTLQGSYYSPGNGGSGYFYTLLKYIHTLMSGYITKLRLIHTDFDTLMDELFVTNWSQIDSNGQRLYETIRTISGENIFIRSYKSDGTFKNSWKSDGYDGDIGILNNGINSLQNSVRVNTNYASTGTEVNQYGYIHSQMINRLYTHYLNVNRYKYALLAITTYCAWKGHTRGWLSGWKQGKTNSVVANLYIHGETTDTSETLQLRLGTYRLTSPFLRTISNVKFLQSGYKVILYESKDLSGDSLEITGTENEVKPLFDLGWNDRAVSVVVRETNNFVSFNEQYDAFYFRNSDSDRFVCLDTVLNSSRNKTYDDLLIAAGDITATSTTPITTSNLWKLYEAGAKTIQDKTDTISRYSSWATKRNAANAAKKIFDDLYDELVRAGISYTGDVLTYKNRVFTYVDDNTATPDANKRDADTNKAFLDLTNEAHTEKVKYVTKYNSLTNTITLTGDISGYTAAFSYSTFTTSVPTTNKTDAITKTNFLTNTIEPVATAKTSFNTTYDAAVTAGITLPQFLIDFKKNSALEYTSLIDTYKPTADTITCNRYKAYIDWLSGKNRINGFKGPWDTLYDNLTTFNNGRLIIPSTLSTDIQGFRTNTYTFPYTETNVQNGTVTLENIQAEVNKLPSTEVIIGYFNTLYAKAITNYTSFRTSVNTYLDAVKDEKWFKLLKNNGIDTYTANTTFDAMYTAISNGTYKFTDTDTPSITVPSPINYDALTTAFDTRITTFRDRYKKLSDFETALKTTDYFKKRRIRLKSDEELNVGDIVSSRNGLSVNLHTSLTNFYTTLDYLLVGGGGGGGGVLVQWDIGRFSWWVKNNSAPGVYGGGGGGSGHMKRTNTLDKFGIDFGEGYNDIYDTESESNTNKKLDTLTIGNNNISVTVGSGGSGSGYTYWSWKDVDSENTRGTQGSSTSLTLTTSYSAKGGTGGKMPNGGSGANDGGNGTNYETKDGNVHKIEPFFGENKYNGTGGITERIYDNIGMTINDEQSFGWGGGGGGGIGGGSGGNAAGNTERVTWALIDINKNHTRASTNGEDFTGAGGGGGGGLHVVWKNKWEHTIQPGARGGHGYAILYLERTSDYTISSLDSYRENASGFENQEPYSKPLVERKILVNSLNTLDFSGNPVPYTFGGFLQSLKAWFTS
jgi:hypothetical protein